MQKRSKVFIWILSLLILSISCQKLTGKPNVEPINATTIPEQAATYTEEDSTAPVVPTPIIETFNLSKKNQRNILADLWDVVNEEYLYEDFNGVDWSAQKEIMLSKIDEGISDQTFYTNLSEMIHNLGDEHSAYLTPSDVEAEEVSYEANDDYVGIGVYISSVPEKDRAVILLVMAGGPAEKAGLKEHDNILAADGELVVDDEGFLLENLLGEVGSEVTVTVQTPGEEPRDVLITRDTIDGGLPVPHQVITSDNGKRVGYLVIATFAESTIADKVGEALQAMGELDGLIIDNRLNGGGYDNMFSQTLGYFLGGNVGAFVNRFESIDLTIKPTKIHNSTTVPIVVLVGIETVSFGEIFSGVMQDQDRAIIIGETTLGNVEILSGFDFADGSRLWIAHDTFIPSINKESNWEADGIIPAIEAISLWHEVTVETDPAVQAALDFLTGN
jgi:carboxyl-terminal processing protease